MNIFNETRPATLADVSWLRGSLARRLAEMRLPKDLTDDLQLFVSEIGSNEVLHAEPPPEHLTLTVSMNGADITVELLDNGGEFADWDDFENSKKAPLDLLATSGRGIWLARNSVDHFVYTRDGNNRYIGIRSLRRKRPTALVVDDVPAMLDLYTEILQSDYRVVACKSFEEAKEKLRQMQIDVVLADVHLGDGLGDALPNEISELNNGSTTPVVLMSSDNSVQTREDALRLGAEFFLMKPVRPKILRDTVAMALSRATLRSARLARAFAHHVDGFIDVCVPPHLGRYALVCANGMAGIGGGDLIVHLVAKNMNRIVVIDVMGHGVGARAWAVAYAAIVRTLHHVAGELTAAEFLTELARIAWKEPTLDRAMATVLVVDLDDNGATVASAGHPHPIVFGAEIRRTSTQTPLLGVFPPDPYESERIELAVGDRLALFTDGLDPAGVAAGDEPPAWFMETLIDARGETFEKAAERLRVATEEALGPNPQDDWTFILVEREKEAV